jgi:hypothetical protein
LVVEHYLVRYTKVEGKQEPSIKSINQDSTIKFRLANRRSEIPVLPGTGPKKNTDSSEKQSGMKAAVHNVGRAYRQKQNDDSSRVAIQIAPL